ncbi:MAG: pilus assembly protein PilM, partial [Actinomycetota bacterium]|nr:pilus assembly protein PilM [Actinomycetota bacterium]
MGPRKASQAIVGLDIEPGFAAAARVSANGRLAVARAALAALAPEVMAGGDVHDVDGLSTVLQELFASGDLGRRVRVGLASPRVSVRLLELPPLSERKDLDAAVRFQAAEEMPIPMDQAVLDYQALGIVPTPAGPRARVVAVAAQRDVVERLLAAVRGAGLRVEGVDLSAFALIRALHRRGEPVGGVTLYASVGGMTNIAIAQDAICLFTRVTANGTEAMADDLAPRHELSIDRGRGWIAHVGG